LSFGIQALVSQLKCEREDERKMYKTRKKETENRRMRKARRRK
jgi:hypothetical protein